eukprot:9168436-Prorocentrum_lima.AAC.1
MTPVYAQRILTINQPSMTTPQTSPSRCSWLTRTAGDQCFCRRVTYQRHHHAAHVVAAGGRPAAPALQRH